MEKRDSEGDETDHSLQTCHGGMAVTTLDFNVLLSFKFVFVRKQAEGPAFICHIYLLL